MNPIIFSLGDTPFIEISEDSFVVNGEDKSWEADDRGYYLVSTIILEKAFREYQERCRERERLNSQPMPSGVREAVEKNKDKHLKI